MVFCVENTCFLNSVLSGKNRALFLKEHIMLALCHWNLIVNRKLMFFLLFVLENQKHDFKTH